jgi:hypothetical protein
MSLLDWTYISLAATSVMGAFLFFAYGWLGPLIGRKPAPGKPVHIRRRLMPFNLVLIHISLASLTLIVFTAELVHRPRATSTFLVAAYAFYLATYLTGLGFFIRFDRRRRRIKPRLLGTHLMMAVVTFTLITSAMALYAYPQPAPVTGPPSRSTMHFLVTQHRSELARYEKEHPGSSPFWWMTGQRPPSGPGVP